MKGLVRELLDLYCHRYFTEEGERRVVGRGKRVACIAYGKDKKVIKEGREERKR